MFFKEEIVIVSGYGLDRPEFDFRQGKRFISSPKHPDGLWSYVFTFQGFHRDYSSLEG
jgi:hypothetical protein